MSKHDNKSEQTREAFGTWRFFNTAADKTDTKRILMLMPGLSLEVLHGDMVCIGGGTIRTANGRSELAVKSQRNGRSYSEISALLMKDSSDLHFAWTCCKPSAPLQLSISLQHAESQLTTPLLSDIIGANTSCSWPYVCVSVPDWINFRCGVCLALLQWVCCDFKTLSPPPPPAATVPPPSSFTPPWRSALPTRHLQELSHTHTHTHTHMPLLMPPNSHIPCDSCTVMERLKESIPPSSTLHLSLRSLFSSPEGSSQTEGS